MIEEKFVLAVVPARGGSKGIHLKNLAKVGGVPLVARVGHVAQAVPEIDQSVVSTDHEEIARVAERAALSAPFRRPPKLSGDKIGDLAVLQHALFEMEKRDCRRYDIVLMLQPTSPMRRPEHVSNCLRMLVEGGWDSVWTVSATDSKAHPLKQLVVKDKKVDYYDADGERIISRQQLNPLYHRNGLAYAFTRDCLVGQESIRGKSSGGLVIKEPVINIDTPFDLRLANLLISSETWG